MKHISQHGSQALYIITLEKTKKNEFITKKLISMLLTQGYKWYVDFYTNWIDVELNIEIYNSSMTQQIKTFMFENSIGEELLCTISLQDLKKQSNNLSLLTRKV